MIRSPHVPLRARASIGDGSTAALVRADGVLDWYCPGRFDAPAALFGLLDEAGGGRVRLGPAHDGRPAVGEQRYDADGVPVLRSLLPGRESLVEVADHLRRGRIVRILTVLRGPAEVALEVRPGQSFGVPKRIERWSGGVAFGELVVHCAAAASPTTRLETGDRMVMTIEPRGERGVVRTTDEGTGLHIADALDSERRVAEEWRPALAEAAYGGPWRDLLLSSLRQLRLLTDRSSGAVVASLSASVPARLGNERSVDRRYAWLRDNGAAVRVLERLELFEWADHVRGWLASVAGDELPLAPVYTVKGERLATETELGLPGWAGNGPVRTSNRAGENLDLAGISAASLALDARRSWRELEAIGDWLAENWARPDHGSYDSRGRPQHHVSSRLAVARAIDALCVTARSRNPLEPGIRGWDDALADVLRWIAKQGLFGHGERSGFRRTPTDDSCDASALRWLIVPDAFALRGDVVGEAEGRLRNTLEQMVPQLSEGPFVHRNLPHVDDGLPPGHGPDLAASFSIISALTSVGRWDEAHARMEALAQFIGPLGIVPAHAELDADDFRGDLPTAAGQIALIEAVLALTGGPR